MASLGLTEDDLLRRAEAAYANGDLRASAQYFAAVAKSNDAGRAATGLYGLGMVALSQDRRPEAGQLFQAAVRADDQLANGWYQLGSLAESTAPDGAMQCYERALAIDPGHRSAQRRIAAMREPSGDPREGVVANLQQRFEQTIGRRTVYVWNFRVDRDGHPPVAVEMRGYRFEGSLANRDRVRLPGSGRAGKVLHLNSIVNLSSNATVRVQRGRAVLIGLSYLLRTVLMLLFLAAFAAAAIFIWTSTH